MNILLLSLFLPIILIYLLHKIKRSTKSSLPPGPPPLPFIGNLPHIATARALHIYLWNLSKKLGPIIHMKLGSTPLLVISSAKLAKEVLKNQDLAFCSRPKTYGLQKLSYNYSDVAFSPYTDTWKELRKITTSHLLSIKKIQSFRSVREDEVYRMIKKIKNVAASQQVVNLDEMAMGLVKSMACRIGFGKDYEEHGSEMRRFSELLKELNAISSASFISDYFPSLVWLDKLSALGKKVDTTFKMLDIFYDELIDDHLDPNRIKMEDEEDDMLDILIGLQKKQASSFHELTRNNIKALLMNIFIGLTQTTAATIVSTMTTLIKAPHIMKKIQNEVRNEIGKKGKIDDDDLSKLPYVKAVVNETLRLFPPVPLLLARETIERCSLDGYEIQPKTKVYVNAWAIGRDPEYWENPNEFVPERFLNNTVDVRGQDFGLVPFGSGRRICPGVYMGLANIELAVANLVYSLDWKFPPGTRAEDVDTDPLPGLIVQKKNSLLLVAKKYDV